MNRRVLVLTVAVCLLLFSSPALAAMEYYTYGGFDPAVIAFQNISRIFGDNAYKAFIVAFATLGISFGSIGAFSRFITGQASNPISWFVPVAVGMTVYSSLFVKTDTLNIYDPVYNQTAVVGGLPVGAVYSAGVINKIERFIVELFDTNAPAPGMNALRYQDHGGAIGFMAMQNSLGEYVKDNKYSRTMMNYVNDCVSFELVRPGTTMTQEQLLNPGNASSLLQVMSAAGNPANYSVSYVTDPTVGTSESCSTIYNELQGYYGNPANAQQALGNACGSSDFADFPRCQQLLADAFTTSFGIAIDPAAFVSNNTIADITAQTLLTAGGSSTAQYLALLKQNQNAVSGGILAGIMNPRMIDAYAAYSILLIPLIAMFIPTPMWQKALGLIVSLMLWNMLLRALDVITFHMWATDYQRAMASMQNVGMGIEAYMQLPMKANKYLGQYATLRNSVFLLATTISGALFKFGDSALSRLAAQSQSHNESINKQASDRGEASKEAMNTVQNAQRAMMVSSLAAGVHGFDNIGRGMAAQEMSGAFGGAGKLDAAGGNVGAMAGMERQAGMARAGQEFGYTGGLSLGQALAKGGIEAAGTAATLAALGADGSNPRSQAYQNAYATTMDNTAKTMATKDVVDKWAKETGTSEKDAYRAYAAMDMANRQGVMKAWGGDVDAYSKFLENSQHISRGERDALTVAAGEAGLSLRDFAKDRATIDKMKDVGMIQALQEGKISSQDLKSMGKTGLLTDAGRMDQWQAVQQMTGMGPREATSFVGAHNEMKSIAGIQEAEKYAGAHNKNYMDLMRAGARSFRMDLSAGEAKQWGLGGRGGTYMVAMGQDGKSVFVDEKSGHSFQRGTFGRSGAQVIEYDEHGKQVGNWTRRDDAFTSKDGRDIQHLDRNETVTSHGDLLNAQTMLQMSLKNDRSAVLAAGQEHADPKRVSASVQHVSSQTAQALSPIIRHEGVNADQLVASAAAQAGIKVPIASISAGFEASGSSRDQWNHDLIQKADAFVLDQARKDALGLGMKGGDFTKYVSDKHSAFVNAMVDMAGGKQNFGTSYPVQAITEVGKVASHAAQELPGVGKAVAKEAFPVAFNKVDPGLPKRVDSVVKRNMSVKPTSNQRSYPK